MLSARAHPKRTGLNAAEASLSPFADDGSHQGFVGFKSTGEMI